MNFNFYTQGLNCTLQGSVLQNNTEGSRFYTQQYILHICSQIYLWRL